MTYKVRVASKTKTIKIVPKSRVITRLASGVLMARTLNELLDFDSDNVNDKFVLMYDASTEKYKMVNPDKVLSASSTLETIQPGLPSDFLDTLDTDLDNRINLDAGTF